jgi:retron-type reverse transcriptase
VIRLLLEAYYEPQFSLHSHGYRPGRGCHTALREVADYWPGTTWFIEGDISDCFGSLDHEVMIGILAEKIHDNRFLRLITQMLQAGYLEDWTWGATLSGAPQGGVVSPILSNIYLHKLDNYVETVLIPRHTRGKRRVENPAYTRAKNAWRTARRRGDRATARRLRQRMRQLPSGNPDDPGFRRLRYSRYADDHLLGFIGPKAEAEQIKDQLATFLREELKLELSPTKTLITHARTRAARYLGYEIITQHTNGKITKEPSGRVRRSANGVIQLRVPRDVIKAKCAPYLRSDKPGHRNDLVNFDDYEIVNVYGARFRGIVQYYLLTHDVCRLTRLQWVMHTSMLKTLAAKHHSTVTKMAAKHKATITTPKGIRTCYEARVPRDSGKPLVARFGGIPLARQKDAVIVDRAPAQIIYPRRELIKRLLKGRCELCHSADPVQVHQIRKLADLDKSGATQPAWTQFMATRRRKTIVVCQTCHDHIHNGQHATRLTA